MSDEVPPPAPESRPAPRPGRPGVLAVTLVSLVLLAGALLAVRAALEAGRGGGSREEDDGPLPVLLEVPDFSLVERGGRTVSRADLRGKVWIVDFIFTSCAGICPEMSGGMRRVHEEIGRDPGAVCVSITVDPETDTPEVLRKYADRHGASPDRWLFLRGEKGAVHALGYEGFAMLDPKDPFLHSQRAALVDGRGRVRGYFRLMEEEGRERLLEAWRRLRDGGDG